MPKSSFNKSPRAKSIAIKATIGERSIIPIRSGSFRKKTRIGSVTENTKFAIPPRECGASQLKRIRTTIKKESARKKMSIVLARIEMISESNPTARF